MESLGRRGLLLVLLLASLSPLHLNYAVRALGTMPATMFSALALYFLTRRGWRLGWLFLGGARLGMSFGSHYAAGSPVVATAFGLVVSCVLQLFNRRVGVGSRLKRTFVAPVVAGVGSVLPLAALEFWAYSGGSSASTAS